MSKRKKEPCPVDGCEHENTSSRLRLHVERKRDELHEAYRREHGIGVEREAEPEPAAPAIEEPAREEPAADPADDRPPEADVPSEEPAGEPEPASAPEPELEDASASEIEVDFGDVAPEVETLVRSPMPEPPKPEAAPAAPAPDAAQPPAPELRPLVIDDAPAVQPAQHGAAPSLGMAVLSPYLKGQINRTVRGATNTWLIDKEQGDTEVSPEEIAALGFPETIAATIDWLERKYGWKLDVDHPIVWWMFALGGFAGVVKQHRAPRDARREDDVEEHEDAGAAPGPAPRAPPPEPEEARQVEPRGPMSDALEAVLK